MGRCNGVLLLSSKCARHTVGSIHLLIGRSSYFGAAVKFYPCITERPRSSASVRHKSFCWDTHGLRLQRGGCWTDDTLTVDAENLETMPPSEIRLKRFKAKRSGQSKQRQRTCIPTQDGRNIARRATVIHRCITSGERLQTLRTRRLKPEVHVRILKLVKISRV